MHKRCFLPFLALLQIAFSQEDATCAPIFTKYWEENTWGGAVSRSGTGSDLIQTEVIRQRLPELLKKYNCRVMLDAPCGDFYWMAKVPLPLEQYIGVDVVSGLIESNQLQFANSFYSFQCIDIIQNAVPKADLILCRDCLVHLSYADMKKAIHHFKESGATYLLTTCFPAQTSNFDIETGEWHPLNFLLEPFHFPPPLEIINENCTEEDGIWPDKSLFLWKIEEIPDFCSF